MQCRANIYPKYIPLCLNPPIPSFFFFFPFIWPFCSKYSHPLKNQKGIIYEMTHFCTRAFALVWMSMKWTWRERRSACRVRQPSIADIFAHSGHILQSVGQFLVKYPSLKEFRELCSNQNRMEIGDFNGQEIWIRKSTWKGGSSDGRSRTHVAAHSIWRRHAHLDFMVTNVEKKRRERNVQSYIINQLLSFWEIFRRWMLNLFRGEMELQII